MAIAFGNRRKAQPDRQNQSGKVALSNSAAANAGRPRQGPAGEKWLVRRDIDLLCALSAMQIRYGRPEEAVAYLSMIREIAPDNIEALRLLLASLIKLQCWREAACLIEELENRQTEPSRMSLLYRAMVEFKLDRLESARRTFSAIVKMGRLHHG